MQIITSQKLLNKIMDHITIIDQREFQSHEHSTIGELFKNIRQNQNIEIEMVSKFLNVRIKDISYLENNEIEKIEKNIYIAGLIKSYGNYLKINDKIIDAKIQDLGLKSNIENKKYVLLNIGENRDLSPSIELFINSSIAGIIIILSFLIIINSFNIQRNLINSEVIINDIQKINN